MVNKIELPSKWVCEGSELKPKTGATSLNTWVLSGREIRPKIGAVSSSTWIGDGQELKPKSRRGFLEDLGY
jgi:hypothetical protein